MLQTMFQAIEQRKAAILEMERYLWKHPEPGYREWNTTRYLAEKYRALGYTLTMAGSIPGFTALADTGRPGPTVCVMGEMDSLICHDHPEADPETGAVHACGHHCQSTALYAVACALAAPGALDGLCGRVLLCAVPAEELIELEYRESLRQQGVIRYFGGKPEFLYRGLLDGVDMTFMLHTANGSGFSAIRGGNGCVLKQLEFQGKTCHASSPCFGVNALYAADLALDACNALRETFRDEEHIRFHPIITGGGTVVNAIPSSVRMESYVRGATMDGILRENRKINLAAAASAAALGANVRVKDCHGYSPLYNDPVLQAIAVSAFTQLVGKERVTASSNWTYGCTDMGDISEVFPSIQPYVGGAAGTGHGNDYRIVDPETACVLSAKGQCALLQRLLENGAASAREVIDSFHPIYPSKEAYFARIDSIFMDRQLVAYDEDCVRLLCSR